MTANLLTIERLSRSFGGLVAVNDLSFAMNEGEIVGLIGPNGSGKTTVLNLISGALRADGGSIRFRDRQLCGMRAHRIARAGIARTFQLVRALEGMSCLENVEAGLAFRPGGDFGARARLRGERLLHRVGLGARMHQSVDHLTYIDRKRVELARALALSPALLLLDEWLAGLNPTELVDGVELVRSLAQEGVAVLLVEHVMDAVHSLCGRCVVMNAGRKIADGPTATVLDDPGVVRAYLGGDEAPIDA